MNENELRYADYCINEAYNASKMHPATLKKTMDYIAFDKSKIVINILIEDNWLINNGIRYELGLGKYPIIEEYGSYSKYKKSIENEQQKLNEEHSEIMQLDEKLKLLSIDNAEFQKTTREQDQRIRDLTEQLNKWSLIQKYWWLIGTCFGIGIGIGKLWIYLH